MSDMPELNTIYHSDALTFVRTMPTESVNCIVTSPPYWGLRDYGVEGQMGMEESLPAFISRMTALFSEARRVLRQDGVLWLNMGDSYASTANGRSAADTKAVGGDDRTFRDKPFSTIGNGIKPKDLCGQPWRLAFALQDDGWYLRSDVIWAKPNPMPESVSDRPTKSHEYVFLMTKSERYWYDADAIREPAVYGDPRPPNGSKGNARLSAGARDKQGDVGKRTYTGFNERWDKRDEPLTSRNKRTVWTIATEPTPFAHFATFPQKLIEPMILAGCPHKVCAVCGAPWVRVIERETNWQERKEAGAWAGNVGVSDNYQNGVHDKGISHDLNTKSVKFLGFEATCECAAETRPGIVLDPFMGSGTTALVARHLGRHFIGSELNPEYVELARARFAAPYTPRTLLEA